MKGQFTKECEYIIYSIDHLSLLRLLVRPLMYSFGDDVNPDPEATNVLEEILIDYIMEICYK